VAVVGTVGNMLSRSSSGAGAGAGALLVGALLGLGCGAVGADMVEEKVEEAAVTDPPPPKPPP